MRVHGARQVVIALSGGELITFELSASGQLMELMKKDMPGDVACLDLLPVPEGRQRAKFLAVGAYDNTVRHPMPACVHAWLFIHYLNCCPSVRAGSSPLPWPLLPSICRAVLIMMFAIASLRAYNWLTSHECSASANMYHVMVTRRCAS